MNHIFPWESKLKHTVVDIKCFFQGVKSLLTKSMCLTEASYTTSQRSKLSFLQQKLSVYSQNNVRKKFHLTSSFYINNPFLTLAPKIVQAFIKNCPKKLFSNCLSRWSINFYCLNIQTF